MKYEIRKVWNPYLSCFMYRLVQCGYCLLPDKQLGSYTTLEAAKESLAMYKLSGEVVYAE
jgi:hypothetical protein